MFDVSCLEISINSAPDPPATLDKTDIVFVGFGIIFRILFLSKMLELQKKKHIF